MAAGSQSTSPEHCSSWPVEQSSPPKSPHASVCASLHSPDLCLRHLAFATGWFSPLDWRLASYGILCWRIASFAQPSVALGSCRHSVVRSPLLKVVAERVGFEPTIRFPVRSLSRRVLSTAQSPLRGHRNFNRSKCSGFEQSRVPQTNGSLEGYWADSSCRAT
jgi:hypothetical protein